MSELVKGILRAVSSALQIPTIIILILLILLTILMLGMFAAEFFTERRTLKLNIPKLVDDLQGKAASQMKEVIEGSSLLKRQKAACQELIDRADYPADTREALARQLISNEEGRYAKITKITDLAARVAPMFGLMGTLIPLGPGLIALGEGDAATLSDSLLIAFDTTVAGLITGAVCYVISGIRKGWYEEYMIGLETIMETILDTGSTGTPKQVQSTQPAGAAVPQLQSSMGTQASVTLQSPQAGSNGSTGQSGAGYSITAQSQESSVQPQSYSASDGTQIFEAPSGSITWKPAEVNVQPKQNTAQSQLQQAGVSRDTQVFRQAPQTQQAPLRPAQQSQPAVTVTIPQSQPTVSAQQAQPSITAQPVQTQPAQNTQAYQQPAQMRPVQSVQAAAPAQQSQQQPAFQQAQQGQQAQQAYPVQNAQTFQQPAQARPAQPVQPAAPAQQSQRTSQAAQNAQTYQQPPQVRPAQPVQPAAPAQQSQPAQRTAQPAQAFQNTMNIQPAQAPRQPSRSNRANDLSARIERAEKMLQEVEAQAAEKLEFELKQAESGINIDPKTGGQN